MEPKYDLLLNALLNINIDTLKEANKFFHLVEMIEPEIMWTGYDPGELWQLIMEAIDQKEKKS